MPTRITFKRDVAGIGAVLKSEAVQRVIKDAADAVSANVAAQKLTASSKGDASPADITAAVTTSTTDRAHANVTIEHPSGQAMQAKHGVLTKAAAQAGLEVKAKGAK